MYRTCLRLSKRAILCPIFRCGKAHVPNLPNLQGLSMPKTCDSLEMFWNSKLLFADRISALSRVDFSGKDFKGGIDCAAVAGAVA